MQRPQNSSMNSPVYIPKSRIQTHYEMFQSYKSILSECNIQNQTVKAEDTYKHKNILENLVGFSITEQVLGGHNNEAINKIKIFDRLFRK